MKKILRGVVLSLVLLFVGLISLTSCGENLEAKLKEEYPVDYEEGIQDIIFPQCLAKMTFINKETKEKVLVIEGIFAYKTMKDGTIKLAYRVLNQDLTPKGIVVIYRITYKCEVEILHPYADSEDEKLKNRTWEEIDTFSGNSMFPVWNTELVSCKPIDSIELESTTSN